MKGFLMNLGERLHRLHQAMKMKAALPCLAIGTTNKDGAFDLTVWVDVRAMTRQEMVAVLRRVADEMENPDLQPQRPT